MSLTTALPGLDLAAIYSLLGSDTIPAGVAPPVYALRLVGASRVAQPAIPSLLPTTFAPADSGVVLAIDCSAWALLPTGGTITSVAYPTAPAPACTLRLADVPGSTAISAPASVLPGTPQVASTGTTVYVAVGDGALVPGASYIIALVLTLTPGETVEIVVPFVVLDPTQLP